MLFKIVGEDLEEGVALSSKAEALAIPVDRVRPQYVVRGLEAEPLLRLEATRWWLP